MFNCRLRLPHLWLGNVKGIRRQKVLPLPWFTDHMSATYKSSMSGNKSSQLAKWTSSTMSVVFTAVWIPMDTHQRTLHMCRDHLLPVPLLSISITHVFVSHKILARS